MRCEECGFEGDELSPAEAIAALRRFPKRYRAPLTRLLPNEDPSVLRRRPDPETWSALEYAAHVRELFAAYAARLGATVDARQPGDDALGSDQHDAAAVSDGLAASAELLASTLESVPPDAWDDVGLGDGEERTVLLAARRAVHEGNHHLLDIGRSLRAARDAARQ